VERTSENGIEYDANLDLVACFGANLVIKIKRLGAQGEVQRD
jgi:hypothetical protein